MLCVHTSLSVFSRVYVSIEIHNVAREITQIEENLCKFHMYLQIWEYLD